MNTFFCKILRHKWRYKDYTGVIKLNGSRHKYTATRLCKRCAKKEFKYSTWIDQKFVPSKEIAQL